MKHLFKYIVGLTVSLMVNHIAMAADTADVAHPTESLDKVVAVVNNDVITENELKRRMEIIKKQFIEKNTPIPANDALVKQVLEYMVSERLQLEVAHEQGVTVPDAAVDEAVKNIAGRNNFSVDQFKEMLAQDGYAYEQFRNDLRTEMILGRVQQRQIMSQVNISEREVDAALKQKALTANRDQYHVGHILIELPENPTSKDIQVGEEKADKVYKQLKEGLNFAEAAASYSADQLALQGGDMGWKQLAELPNIFVEPLLKMSTGDISKPIRTQNGFHIITLLDKKSEETQAKFLDQTQARHILIKTNAITSDADAQKILNSLRERIAKGELFADLAKEYSDDPLSGKDGGNLGWVSPGDLVPAFEAVMNKLPIGEVSEPFKSNFGWHILEVQGRRKFDNTKAAEEDEMRRLIQNRKYQEALQEWILQLRDQAHVEIKAP